MRDICDALDGQHICYLPRAVCGQNKCHTFLGKWSKPPRSSSSMEMPVVIPRNVTLCRTNKLSGKKVNMLVRMKMKMLTKVMIYCKDGVIGDGLTDAWFGHQTLVVMVSVSVFQ